MLRNIEAFVRVADTLSFSRAARALGVSTSVLSTRLKQLEAHVHAPLVHRTTRTMAACIGAWSGRGDASSPLV
jgi:DNA-binding transcriptional LysR family regulator